MPRRNRRAWVGPARLGDWPADLRPLIPNRRTAQDRTTAFGAVGECRWTGKDRYPTQAAARAALVGAIVMHNRGVNQRREQRAYACMFPMCGGWHLTSQRRPPVPRPRDAGDAAVEGGGPVVSGPDARIGTSQPATRSTP